MKDQITKIEREMFDRYGSSRLGKMEQEQGIIRRALVKMRDDDKELQSQLHEKMESERERHAALEMAYISDVADGLDPLAKRKETK